MTMSTDIYNAYDEALNKVKELKKTYENACVKKIRR